jgi:glyoxylase-like metal-dependent hydrolase (beta-lactamase superfamily II)
MTIKHLCATLAFITMGSLSFADNHQASSFKVTEIKPSLLLLQGKGGNIALSRGADGLLIIDDDYADMAAALKSEIEKLGGMNKLKFILNTHWHADHTGGNDELGDNVNIIAHDNVRSRLSNRGEVTFFNMVSEAQPKHALPNLTYPDSMRIHFNDQDITLQHYANGHTDGDSVVYFKQANVIHMGDHMFNTMFPFVDIGSGGNAVSFTNNVAQILTTIDDKTIVIPGHGPVTDKQGLSAYLNMLRGTIAEVEAMKKSGLTLEQAQQKGLSQQWQTWNIGFIKQDNWINFIYKSL